MPTVLDRDLHHQLGGSLHVIIIGDPSLAAALGINHQQCIGLGLIILVEPGTRVVGDDNTFRDGLITSKPNHDLSMWFSVMAKSRQAMACKQPLR